MWAQDSMARSNGGGEKKIGVRKKESQWDSEIAETEAGDGEKKIQRNIQEKKRDTEGCPKERSAPPRGRGIRRTVPELRKKTGTKSVKKNRSSCLEGTTGQWWMKKTRRFCKTGEKQEEWASVYTNSENWQETR